MANLTLKQLREAQKANPPLVNADGEPSFDSQHTFGHPPAATAGPAAGASLPLQASALVPAAAAGGYCRIFPPTFPSIADIPQGWKDANWTGNGPWQNLEGWPPHPDFEANLTAVEQTVTPE